MQASPASARDKQDLATWLQNRPSHSRSNAKSTAANNSRNSNTATQDLTWLTQHGKDLSCVSIHTVTAEQEKDGARARVGAVNADTNINAGNEEDGTKGPGVGEGGGGGVSGASTTGMFIGLFTSCTSKRK